MGRFVPNPRYEAQAKRDPQMRAMLRNRAAKAAQEVERIGRTFARSYKATVEETADGVRIEGNTDGINAASWAEFGSQNNPAYAPLRRGTEAAGLKIKGVKR